MSDNGNLNRICRFMNDIFECDWDHSNNKWHFKGWGVAWVSHELFFFLSSDLIVIVSKVIFGRAILDFKIHFIYNSFQSLKPVFVEKAIIK